MLFIGSSPIEVLGSANFSFGSGTGGSATLTIALSKVPESYIVAFSSATAQDVGDGNTNESRSATVSSTSLSGNSLRVVVSSQAWAYHAVKLSGTVTVYGY